jgi:hypothetical protein
MVQAENGVSSFFIVRKMELTPFSGSIFRLHHFPAVEAPITAA